MASFTGGTALQRKLTEIAKQIESASSVRVGFLEDSTYDDGTQTAYVAALNEFGDPDHNQPPRPFFRNMIAANQGGWGAALGKTLKASNFNTEQAFSLMGDGMKGQLQKSIQQLDSPPLSPKTIARKGFSKPLIDTGHMFNSVDYEVKK